MEPGQLSISDKFYNVARFCIYCNQYLEWNKIKIKPYHLRYDNRIDYGYDYICKKHGHIIRLKFDSESCKDSDVFKLELKDGDDLKNFDKLPIDISNNEFALNSPCPKCKLGVLRKESIDELYCDIHHCHYGTNYRYICNNCYQHYCYSRIFLNC